MKAYDIADRRQIALESDDISPTLISKMGTGGGNVPVIIDATHCDSVVRLSDKAPTLQARMGTGGGQVPLICLMDQGGSVMNFECDKTGTLRAQEHGHAPIVSNLVSVSSNSWKSSNPHSGCPKVDVAPALDTTEPQPSRNQGGVAVVQSQSVRRLTPLECERLQGFPDNWTRIPYKGKSAENCPDSPRYKAIGNSWAVPCVHWLGRMIDAEFERMEGRK